MNQQDYDREYGRLKKQLKDIENKQRECKYLQGKILEEEESMEHHNIQFIRLYEESELRWIKNHGVQTNSFLFADGTKILQEIRDDRNEIIFDGHGVLGKHMQSLHQMEEDCMEQLALLKRNRKE